MPTFKNIRIKKRGGGTRTQRVQVLASGKYKFVKNITNLRKGYKRTSKKGKTRRKRSSSKKVNRTGKSKFFKNLSGVGFVEDAAVGYIGLQMLGPSVGPAAALPMTRVIQGLAGHAMGRRGKGRLMYGIIDLIDLYLSGQWSGSIPLLKGNGIKTSFF